MFQVVSPLKPIETWYRCYLQSPALVMKPTDAAYSAYANMSQVVGGMYGSASPVTGMLQGGIDTPATAWAGVNLSRYYKATKDATLLPRIKAIGDFFITYSLNIKIWDYEFKAFPNAVLYSSATRQWSPNVRTIHTRTFFHVAWSLLEIYDVTREEKYLTLAGQLIDTGASIQMIVNGQAAGGEIAPYFKGALFNALESADGINFEPSWNTFANTTGDVFVRATDKYFELFGSATRTAFHLYDWAVTTYNVKSIATDYINHLVDLYNNHGLRKTTGHKLIYNFSHYSWTDAKHPDGYHIPVPKNWDFLNDIYGEDQWFTGDLMLWGILGFALAGHTQIATDLINQFYTLKTPDSSGRLLFYDRYTGAGQPLADDKSKSITFTALYMNVRNALRDSTHYGEALDALDFYQIDSTSLSVDGSYSWDTTDPTAVIENKTLGEVLFAILTVSDVIEVEDTSSSPIVRALPKAPSRVSAPANFLTESALFLNALPAFKGQFNALVGYVATKYPNRFGCGRINVPASPKPVLPVITIPSGSGVTFVSRTDAAYKALQTLSTDAESYTTYLNAVITSAGTVAYDGSRVPIPTIADPQNKTQDATAFNASALSFLNSVKDTATALQAQLNYLHNICFTDENMGSITDATISETISMGSVTDNNIMN